VEAQSEKKLKQLMFQSRHRGFAELDLLLGNFACAELAHLSPELLIEYEQLLGLSDWDVYVWLVGQTSPPPTAPLAIISHIQAYMVGRDG
jgi:antitoxin CptB